MKTAKSQTQNPFEDLARYSTPSIKRNIYQYVKDYGHVSFAELRRHIKGFAGKINLANVDYPNVIFWCSLSRSAYNAITELRREKRIFFWPCRDLIGGMPGVYFCDGGVLNMPIVKRPVQYKKPHWMPVTLHTIEYREPVKKGKALPCS